MRTSIAISTLKAMTCGGENVQRAPPAPLMSSSERGLGDGSFYNPHVAGIAHLKAKRAVSM